MLVVGAILLLAASLVQRRTWVVFGAAGVAAGFGHYLVTQSSWFRYVLFAIALAAFVAGLLVGRTRSTGSSCDAGPEPTPPDASAASPPIPPG
jgi:hypothetical protein